MLNRIFLNTNGNILTMDVYGMNGNVNVLLSIEDARKLARDILARTDKILDRKDIYDIKEVV